MKRCGPGMGCMAQWRLNSRSSAHQQEGGVDGLLLSFKKLLGQSGTMLTTRESRMGYEKET